MGRAAAPLVAILETEDGMTMWNGVLFGTLILAPPRSKKTVRLAATQLLVERGKGSFMVLDPKGQIAAITANRRGKVGGAENVKIINPCGVLVEK